MLVLFYKQKICISCQTINKNKILVIHFAYNNHRWMVTQEHTDPFIPNSQVTYNAIK